MIANARMYSVSPEAAALWRTLLAAIIAKTSVPATVIDYPSPAPLEDLWARSDQAAVFMCGLPFSRSRPQPLLVAAPVPSPPEFGDRAQYWSDLVVREDRNFSTLEDTFGGKIAFTTAESQSGCTAALTYFMSLPAARAAGGGPPLFSEIVAPSITPLGALNAVIGGSADIAPLDSYALRLLRKFRPDLTSQVRVIGHTAPTPIPPLIASRPGHPALQSAFAGAHHDATLRILMEQLLLQRFARPAPDSYDSLRRDFETARTYWQSHRFAATAHPAFAAIFQ